MCILIITLARLDFATRFHPFIHVIRTKKNKERGERKIIIKYEPKICIRNGIRMKKKTIIHPIIIIFIMIEHRKRVENKRKENSFFCIGWRI